MFNQTAFLILLQLGASIHHLDQSKAALQSPPTQPLGETILLVDDAVARHKEDSAVVDRARQFVQSLCLYVLDRNVTSLDTALGLTQDQGRFWLWYSIGKELYHAHARYDLSAQAMVRAGSKAEEGSAERRVADEYVAFAAENAGDLVTAYGAAHRYSTAMPTDWDMQSKMKRMRLKMHLNDGFDHVNHLTLDSLLAAHPRYEYGARWENVDARLLVVTVATDPDPGLKVLNASCLDLNIQLRVAGMGETFSGYGFKLLTLERALREARAEEYTHFLFVDAYDVVIAAPVAEILDKFHTIGAPLVVSAETNCFPDGSLCDMFPPARTPYRYLNSGAMMGEIDYFLKLLNTTMGIPSKPACVDDQHELSLLYVSDPSVFHLDTDCVLFQSLVGTESGHLMDLRRPRNMFTGTAPAVFHANGYDKAPLGHVLLALNWFHTDWEAFKFFKIMADHKATTAKRDQAVERCFDVSMDHARETYEWGRASHTYQLVEDPAALNLTERAAQLGVDEALYLVDGDRDGGGAVEVLPHPVNRSALDLPGWLARRRELNTAARLPAATAELYAHVDAIRPLRFFQIPEYRSKCADDWAAPEVARCTMATCFDAARCPSDPSAPFKVYVYPYNASELSPPYLAIVEHLSASPYATADPKEACLLVPGVDTYCTLERCMLTGSWLETDRAYTRSSAEIARALAALPHWDGGRNHLIFQHHESPCSPYPIGKAILAKTDISDFHYRWGFDVSLPYVPLKQFLDRKAPLPTGEQRDLLAVFKGARTNPVQADRAGLSSMSSPADGVVVVTLCRVFGYVDEGCRLDEVEYIKHSYEGLLLRSQFAYVLIGYGYGSYRLVEVLASGAIPVIAVDHWILPLSDVIDWSEFAVLIPQADIHHSAELLRAIPAERRERMRARAREIYERFFFTQERYVHAAIELVRARIQGTHQGFAERDLPHSKAMTMNNTALAEFFLDADYYTPNLVR